MMNTTFFVYLLFLILNYPPSNAQHLEDLKWKKRVLILKSTDKDEELFLRQLKAFENDRDGMIERKLVIYILHEKSIRFIDFKSSHPKELDVENVQKYGQHLFENNSTFEVILIGLDGTVKRRQKTFLPLEILYSLIDGMPMRRAELKGKN